MNKTELIAAVAEEAGLTKGDAAKAVGALFNQIEKSLAKGEPVQIIGFGTFDISEYQPRTGRNPQTGAEIQIPGGKRPKFVAGASLKKAVH